MAVRMRFHIDSAKEQREKLKAKGFDISSRDEQIERLKQREQDHFEFVMKFHKLDRAELDEIIYEGDRNNWPTAHRRSQRKTAFTAPQLWASA